MKILDDFLLFLERCPTVFHAGKEITSSLQKKGFIPLKESAQWHLKPNQGYFLTRGDSFIAAFKTPKAPPKKASILACHTDSPGLKLKPCSEHLGGPISQFNVEVYGSPNLSSWFDRDLYLAGRISVLNKGIVESKLVELNEIPFIIPQLAVHLDRSEKKTAVSRQDHLRPVTSINQKEIRLEEFLRRKEKFDSLLGFDLFLVPKESPRFLGFNLEFIASHKLDNLSSAFAVLHALESAPAQKETLQIGFFWDHEEIGSMSSLGADCRVADEVLERISLSFKMGREEFFCMKSASFCISSDLAHGWHPNFPEKYDLQNSPLLGAGPVLKFNANHKYATSGEGAAKLLELGKRKNIALQTFASHSDLSTGSTVGPIMSSQLGIEVIDLGIASWAMHSIRETIAKEDQVQLCSLFEAVFEEGVFI